MKNDQIFNLIQQLRLAAALLTRLPLPHLPETAFSQSHRATWAYPVVGAGLGVAASVLGMCLMYAGLPTGVVAGVIIAAMTITTGAMHEDGLADTVDGFWGGWTPAQRLEIMKDSHIGTYGVLALIMAIGLKWWLYVSILGSGFTPLILAALISRAAMPAVMRSLPHARQTGLSHSVGRPDKNGVWIAAALGFGAALTCAGNGGISAFALAMMVSFGVAHIARRKIGGQTGDVIGTVQILTELAVLAVFAANLA